MIYLIDAPPRCGKSTAARRLSVLTGACWFPADYVGSMITGYIPEPDRDTLWPYSSLGADERYATFTAEEIIKSYRTRARTSWMALESLVEYAVADGRDFVVEGYHVEPEFARRMIAEHGESNVRACLLCKHDQADIVAGIAKGVPENDGWQRCWATPRSIPPASTASRHPRCSRPGWIACRSTRTPSREGIAGAVHAIPPCIARSRT
ncbi:MAG: hypothetical protein M3P51_10975, partial [Chloroflexota bacterium]|nr:hypothetical protein [Chloroflexota bacterium]